MIKDIMKVFLEVNHGNENQNFDSFSILFIDFSI